MQPEHLLQMLRDKNKSDEAFKKLAHSENPKTIMLDQNTPVMNMFGKD